MKSPYKKNNELILTFDISTMSTGYCFLLNNRPIIEKNKFNSVGQIKMVNNKEYTNYGERMFFGSYQSIQKIENILYQFLKPINDTLSNLSKAKKEVPNFKSVVVFETSEIPNFAKGTSYASIATIKKLAFYVGAILKLVADAFHLFGYMILKNIHVKMIKPIEWQRRVFVEVPGTWENSKKMSVKYANEISKKWGLEVNEKMDDMADAICISSVAKKVRDDMFARKQARIKKMKKRGLDYLINKSKSKLEMLKNDAYKIKQNILVDLLWFKENSENYNNLSSAEKAKFTKLSKIDLLEFNAKKINNFLPTPKKNEYKRLLFRINDLLKIKGNYKNEKVISNS